MFKIGNVELDNPFILAPLAGVTDAPFRLLCREKGVGLTVTEMVSAKGLFYGDKNTEKLLFSYEEDRPIAFQIFGSEPDVIKYAADALAPRENVILDINMGCPVPKIVKNGEGSALSKNPDLIYELVRAAVQTAGKPVTAKIRLGWDENSINGIEMAKAIESGGGSAVAVHGRTREQFYHGTANWDEIGKIKKAVRIPVIGNGDIHSGADAIDKMQKYGVDGIMIGRGAMGNPWIFEDCICALQGKEFTPPTVEERVAMLVRQLEIMSQLKGEYVAVRQIRSHAAWYLKGIRGSAEVKRKLNTINTKEEIVQLLETVTTNE